MQPAIVKGMAFATAAMLLLADAPPAVAQDCGPKLVKAAGAPAVLERVARSRARSAWVNKVKAKKALGPEYARWSPAREAVVSCKPAGRRIACEAVAIPCKP